MTTAQEGVRDQRHEPAALYSQERPGTHCTGGWVGPEGRSGQIWKISLPPGFDPQTVQPVASRYTDYANRPSDLINSNENVPGFYWLGGWVGLDRCISKVEPKTFLR